MPGTPRTLRRRNQTKTNKQNNFTDDEQSKKLINEIEKVKGEIKKVEEEIKKVEEDIKDNEDKLEKFTLDIKKAVVLKSEAIKEKAGKKKQLDLETSKDSSQKDNEFIDELENKLLEYDKSIKTAEEKKVLCEKKIKECNKAKQKLNDTLNKLISQLAEQKKTLKSLLDELKKKRLENMKKLLKEENERKKKEENEKKKKEEKKKKKEENKEEKNKEEENKEENKEEENKKEEENRSDSIEEYNGIVGNKNNGIKEPEEFDSFTFGIYYFSKEYDEYLAKANISLEDGFMPSQVDQQNLKQIQKKKIHSNTEYKGARPMLGPIETNIKGMYIFIPISSTIDKYKNNEKYSHIVLPKINEKKFNSITEQYKKSQLDEQTIKHNIDRDKEKNRIENGEVYVGSLITNRWLLASLDKDAGQVHRGSNLSPSLQAFLQYCNEKSNKAEIFNIIKRNGIFSFSSLERLCKEFGNIKSSNSLEIRDDVNLPAQGQSETYIDSHNNIEINNVENNNEKQTGILKLNKKNDL